MKCWWLSPLHGVIPIDLGLDVLSEDPKSRVVVRVTSAKALDSAYGDIKPIQVWVIWVCVTVVLKPMVPAS
jgi:hypothetical protein